MTEWNVIVPCHHPTLVCPAEEQWTWLEERLDTQFQGWHRVNGHGSWRRQREYVRIYTFATDWGWLYVREFLESVRRTFRQECLYASTGGKAVLIEGRE